MQFPMTIGLHRSRFLDLALLIVLLLTISLLMAWPVAMVIRVGCLVLAVLAGWLAHRQLSPRLVAIRLERDGEIRIALSDQDEFRSVRALPGATVHPWLTVLGLQDEQGVRHTLLATGDMMQPDDFRRLRVFLRWRAKFNATAGSDA